MSDGGSGSGAAAERIGQQRWAADSISSSTAAAVSDGSSGGARGALAPYRCWTSGVSSIFLLILSTNV